MLMQVGLEKSDVAAFICMIDRLIDCLLARVAAVGGASWLNQHTLSLRLPAYSALQVG